MLNVIIPAYNCNKTLPKTLASLQAQTKSNFIVTIVDDCSNEDIMPIIERFKRSLSIRYIKNEFNVGPGLSRQNGLDAENMCDYIVFLDADDMLYPRALEILYSEAKKNNADIVFSDIQTEYDNKNIGKIEFGRNTTWFHGKIYKTKYLKELNIDLNKVNIKYNEDSYFNLIATILAKRKFTLNEITYFWRNNKESLTRKEENFIYKYNKDYLTGQIAALNFIFDKEPELEFNIAPTLLNIYNSYELECINQIENIEDFNKQIYNLFARKEFYKLFNTADTLRYIIVNGRQGRFIGNDIIYYRHSFSSFLDFFGITLGG